MTIDKSKKLLINRNLWVLQIFQIDWIANYLRYEMKYWFTWISLVSVMVYQTIYLTMNQAAAKLP
ncbi:MAG: hypothetical protein HC903_27850 [Methylacidiphilales bacterium]|nr:hypothetical protein [Candidatus Methylacidiphilales bacterium]NJR19593.1 hypothetical protein [Calothrix sp. CSU_2_0]